MIVYRHWISSERRSANGVVNLFSLGCWVVKWGETGLISLLAKLRSQDA